MFTIAKLFQWLLCVTIHPIDNLNEFCTTKWNKWSMISNYWRKKSNECTVHDSDYKTDSAAVYRGLVQATKFLAKLSASPTCNCKTYSLSSMEKFRLPSSCSHNRNQKLLQQHPQGKRYGGRGGLKFRWIFCFGKKIHPHFIICSPD